MSHMSGYAASISVSAGSTGPEWMMKAGAASCFEGARSPTPCNLSGTVRQLCASSLRVTASRGGSQASILRFAVSTGAQIDVSRWEGSPVRSEHTCQMTSTVPQGKAGWGHGRHTACSSSSVPGLYLVLRMPLLLF